MTRDRLNLGPDSLVNISVVCGWGHRDSPEQCDSRQYPEQVVLRTKGPIDQAQPGGLRPLPRNVRKKQGLSSHFRLQGGGRRGLCILGGFLEVSGAWRAPLQDSKWKPEAFVRWTEEHRDPGGLGTHAECQRPPCHLHILISLPRGCDAQPPSVRAWLWMGRAVAVLTASGAPIHSSEF